MELQDKRINYIEFSVTDIAGAKAFYGDVFGWSFTDYGPEYCEFNDGRMKGGFETSGSPGRGGALVGLYGNDLEALSQTIVKAGGQITRPVFSFPGGRRFQFCDPSGNELAVWCEA